MRILLVGAGGVGGPITTIAAPRGFPEAVVIADFDPARAEKAVASVADERFTAAGWTPRRRTPSARSWPNTRAMCCSTPATPGS